MKTKLATVAIALMLSAGLPTAAQAKQVTLNVGLGTPEVLAGQVQKAYLKVSLEGLRRDPRTTRIPVNVALVLDKSGSMRGEKINNTREAARTAVGMLGGEDIVSIVAYDDAVRVLVPATKLTDHNTVYNALNNLSAGGKTALFAGVSKGANETRKFLDEGRVNRVVLLSDGLANVGPSSPNALGRLGASLSREGISVTTIGLGLDYNEDLMTELAGRSDGNHIFAEQWSDLARIFRNEFNDVLAVVAQDVDIRIRCARGVRPLRVIGRTAEINGNTVHTRLNQIYSEQEKFLVLEVEIPAGEDGERLELASVEVDYTNMENRRREHAKAIATVAYVQSEDEVEQAMDREVIGEAVELEVNEYSKRAVELRDQGRVEEAREALGQAQSYIIEQAPNMYAPAASSLRSDLQKDSDAIEDKADWKRNRKVLKEKQYKLENQQSN